MISSATGSIIRFLAFLGIALLHLILLVLLGHVVRFHELAPVSELKVPNFQMVKIAPPPIAEPLPPPQLSMPPMAKPAGSGSETLHPSVVIMMPTKATFSPPTLPSTEEMLVRLPKPNFGHGSGTGSRNGNGFGIGNGNVGPENGTDLSQDQQAMTAPPRKMGSNRIFEYLASDNIEAARTWLDEGNDPDVWKRMRVPNEPEYRVCPLYLAIRNNQREMVEMLLAHGANPDPDPFLGFYSGSVHFAVQYHCSPEIVKLLLNHGAKPDYRMASDPTHAKAPEWPIERGRNSALEAVQPSLMDSKAVSPADQVAILKLLLEHGANPLRKDDYGNTALSMARGMNREDMVSAIEESLKESYDQNKR